MTAADLVISRGERWRPTAAALDQVTQAADTARVDPRLLLAVLIRESGDSHLLDWLAATAVARLHQFSVGTANMKWSAFEEARAYARGHIDYGWTSIAADPAKAVQAAAYLLAKRRSQLSPYRDPRYSDAEYLRVGYRSGYRVMALAEASGAYLPGVQLFDLAYVAAGNLLGLRAPPTRNGGAGCGVSR